MNFKKYFSARKGKWSEENAALAEKFTQSQKEPTEEELKCIKWNYRKSVDYQDAINKLLGTKLFLLGLDLKTLDTLYEKIKLRGEKK